MARIGSVVLINDPRSQFRGKRAQVTLVVPGMYMVLVLGNKPVSLMIRADLVTVVAY